MVHVVGSYCPNVVQNCVKKNVFTERCDEFELSRCLSRERQHMNFCIDREEYVEDPEADLRPKVDVDWFEAQRTCQSLGKRLCTHKEWTTACEGPDILAYPYGQERADALEACNRGRVKNLRRMEGKTQVLVDHRAPITEYPECLSYHGVHNMVGNVDEWVVNTDGHEEGVPYVSGLKGGWWGPVRNRCRPMTTGHNMWHKQEQIGFRCCKES